MQVQILSPAKTMTANEQRKQRALRQWEDLTLSCRHCLTPLPYEKRYNKFCGSSCAASYNNKKFPKKPATPRAACAFCGAVFVARYRKKFCSHECSVDHRSLFFMRGLLDSWRAGKHEVCSPDGQLSQALRKYLIFKAAYCCQECGWSKRNPHTGKTPLEVDHIDGDYRNNSESNLRVLCPSCHSLTASYKGANKGKGRAKRKRPKQHSC